MRSKGLSSFRAISLNRPALDEINRLTGNTQFDLVLSDMAPNITGIALQDQARYERLLESVLEFCQVALRPRWEFAH